MPFLGEITALVTASFWAVVSMLFTVAARRVGTLALNQARITLAWILLVTVLLLTRGVHWAPQAETRNVVLLLVSGFVGLTLGDWAFFSAFVHVGPRITTLLMTLAPPFTAVLAFFLLHESLGPLAVLGMGVTLAGVAWVVLEQSPSGIAPGKRTRGLVMGVVGSLGQALGLVLSKQGMGEVVDPFPATAIRMTAAVVGIWIIAAAGRRSARVTAFFQDRTARWALLGATILGPVLGVWLSLVAVRLTQAGIAATLMATTPVLILPLVIFFQHEKVSPRAAAGAAVAVAGVALLFLR